MIFFACFLLVFVNGQPNSPNSLCDTAYYVTCGVHGWDEKNNSLSTDVETSLDDCTAAYAPARGLFYEIAVDEYEAFSISVTPEQTDVVPAIAVWAGEVASCGDATCLADAQGTSVSEAVSLTVDMDGESHAVMRIGGKDNTTGAVGWTIRCGKAGYSCDRAIDLSCGTTITVDNIGLLHKQAEPRFRLCGEQVSTVDSGTVYLRFVAPYAGTFIIDNCGGPKRDGMLGVYRGSCATGTCITGSDDACGGPGSGAEVLFDAGYAGEEFTVVQQGFNDVRERFKVTTTCFQGTPAPPTPPTPPPTPSPIMAQGGTCALAVALLCNTSFATDTSGPGFAPLAGSYVGCNTNADLSNVAYYTFTAPVTGDYIFDTCDPSTNYDTILVAYEGTCDTFSCRGSNDDSVDEERCSAASELPLTLTAGDRITMVQSGFQGEQGLGVLRLTCPPADLTPAPTPAPSPEPTPKPTTTDGPGSSCVSALTAECDAALVVDTSLFPQGGDPFPPCGGRSVHASSTVFFTFTTPAAGTFTMSVCDSAPTFSAAISLFGGDCTVPTCLASTLSCSIDIVAAAAGETYTIALHGAALADSGEATLVVGCDYTAAPTPAPTTPTASPTESPTNSPTSAPTAAPTAVGDTRSPTVSPTPQPTALTLAPTPAPTSLPTSSPTPSTTGPLLVSMTSITDTPSSASTTSVATTDASSTTAVSSADMSADQEGDEDAGSSNGLLIGALVGACCLMISLNAVVIVTMRRRQAAAVAKAKEEADATHRDFHTMATMDTEMMEISSGGDYRSATALLSAGGASNYASPGSEGSGSHYDATSVPPTKSHYDSTLPNRPAPIVGGDDDYSRMPEAPASLDSRMPVPAAVSYDSVDAAKMAAGTRSNTSAGTTTTATTTTTTPYGDATAVLKTSGPQEYDMVVDQHPVPEYAAVQSSPLEKRASARRTNASAASATRRSPGVPRRKVRKRLSMEDIDSIKDLDTGIEQVTDSQGESIGMKEV